MKKIALCVVAGTVFAMLAGCQATGDQYAANVYSAGQVNSRQAAKVVTVLAVLPAKVAVDNTQNKQRAQVAGALLGAVAGAFAGNAVGHGGALLGGAAGAGVGAATGSLVNDTTLVDGVSLTYNDAGNVFNSAQVGKLCEYKPGSAVMVSTGPTETRIQPNATCPVPVAK
jgi:outer membrane lipoprotein SlyB